MDEKSISFYNIIKSLGFKNINNINPTTFDFFFGIPDTKEFFDWFLTNINSDCYLSPNEVKSYEEKLKKSQVIFDIDKLKALANIKEHGDTASDFKTIDGYKRTLEQLEAENKILEAKITVKKLQKQCLIDELKEMKIKKKQRVEKTQHDLNLKQIYMKNMFKSLNTQFKSLVKVLNNELCASGSFSSKFQEVAKTDIENLVTNEENYLNLIRNLLNSSKIFEVTENSVDDFKSKILLFQNFYPKLILNWFDTKVEKTMLQSQLDELMKFQKLFTVYLLHKNSSDQEGEFSNLVEKTRHLEMNKKILRENCQKLGSKIAITLKQLTNLKLANLVNYEADSKQLNYNFLILKQEKLMNSLINQHARITLLINMEKMKLNDFNLVKKMLDLIKSKSSVNTSVNSISMNYDMSYSSSLTFSSIQISNNQNDKFYHIMNQLLIVYLTKLSKCFIDVNVSIKLNENLLSLVDLHKKYLVEEKKRNSSNRSDLANFYEKINKAVNIFYGSTNDLSKININMKLVDSKETRQLNEKMNEIQNLFCSKIYKIYSSRNSILNNSKLEKIKRNFFIDFYLNPQNVSTIIQNL